MKLGELIDALKAAPNKEGTVSYGFGAPHSSRGFYEQLAFDPAENVTIQSMLDHARSADGAILHGWKGGDFPMSRESSPLWIEPDGNWDENGISPQLVWYWLQESGNEGAWAPTISTNHWSMA